MRPGAELQHAVNGWLQGLLGPSPSAGRARSVTVPSRYEEDQQDDLATAAQSVTRATMGALQKQIRAAGFKGALVSGWGKGTAGGFTVHYQGQQYDFGIDEAKMRNNGRGLYHETGAIKHDMVLHQDHRGRWRIDLVTSAGGAHTDVTGREEGSGPNQGYGSAESAFQGALDEQRRRGIRGKSHVWVLLPDGGIVDYVPEGASGVSRGQREIFRNNPGQSDLYADLRAAGCQIDHHESDLYVLDTPDARALVQQSGARHSLFTSDADGKRWIEVPFHYTPHWPTGHQSNGRRTGILSDGTRVNVYHQPGSLDEYTIVPHSEAWDSMARGDMREMLGTSSTGRGFSQWTTGQEGRHLGRQLAWVEVPEELKRHIEQRVAKETMVANARKKRLTVADLPSKNRVLGHGERSKVLACPGCGEEFSADPSDYFMMRPGEPLKCMHCGGLLQLAERRRERQPPPQEARHTPGNREWDQAEDKGLVRIVVEEEQENYFDVYGRPESMAEYDEIVEILNRDGLNVFASQYRKRKTDEWETADSIGMVIGSLADSGYEDSLKQAALDALKGHKPNARTSTVDEHAKTELTLYIENEYALIGAPNSIGKSIDANLRKKVASGKYDPALAPQAWQHLIDEGAKRHAKAYSTGDHAQIFSAATRRAVAADFARAWEAENPR